MEPDKSNALHPKDFDDFLLSIRKECNLFQPTTQKDIFIYLEDSNKPIRISFFAIDKAVDSSDITPTHWKNIAIFIAGKYNEFDGFIVLHGSDTMAFTASALSFAFSNLSKPIILTGSQKPYLFQQSDALTNLITSIKLSSYKILNIPLIPEVIITFGGRIIRGCRATKISTTDPNCFDSPNYPLLGTSTNKINIDKDKVLPLPSHYEQFSVYPNFSDRVASLFLFPGINIPQIKAVLSNQDTLGIVIFSFGTGNTPSNSQFYDVIRESTSEIVSSDKYADKKGRKRILVTTTQCLKGSLKLGSYQASKILSLNNVANCLDITKEAAITKLMWVIENHSELNWSEMMQKSLKGEQSIDDFGSKLSKKVEEDL